MKKTYNKKSKEDKEREVNELLEKANEGIAKCFTSSEQFKELASYMSKFYNYSFRNTFLIQEQFEGALAVGSYAFWKEKGFTVNKGEKGIKILVPNTLSDYFINSKGEEVKLSKATPEEKRLIEQGEIEVRKGKLIFNQGYVFEVSQTNAKAEDLPKIFPGRWLDGEVKNYDLMYKAMENIAKKIGVKIIEPKGELGAVKGVSYPLTKEVALNPRNTQLQNVKTLIHELAHAKLHTMETRDNYTTNEKEFQAEMSAYVVCSYFGLDTSEYSFRYISSWTEDVELKDKEKLINEVRETVKEYIEVIEDTLINSKDLSLELEKEVNTEIKLEDEKLINFIGKDKVIINEINKEELERKISENNSYIFLENDRELSSKNYVMAINEKGIYKDLYINKNYKLENLIYIDDNKNLYRVKENINYDKNLYEVKEQEVMNNNSIKDIFKNLKEKVMIKVNSILGKETEEFDIEKELKEFEKLFIEVEDTIEKTEFNTNKESTLEEINIETAIIDNEEKDKFLSIDTTKLIELYEKEISSEDKSFMEKRGLKLSSFVESFRNELKNFEFIEGNCAVFAFDDFLEKELISYKEKEYEEFQEETYMDRLERQSLGEEEFIENYGKNDNINSYIPYYVRAYTSYENIDKDKLYIIKDDMEINDTNIKKGEEFKIVGYDQGLFIIEFPNKDIRETISFEILKDLSNSLKDDIKEIIELEKSEYIYYDYDRLKEEFIKELKNYKMEGSHIEEFFDYTFDIRKINNMIVNRGEAEVIEDMVSTYLYSDSVCEELKEEITYSEVVLRNKDIAKDSIIKLAGSENISYSDLSKIKDVIRGDELSHDVDVIDRDKEYKVLIDIESKDGSFIRKGTSFFIEGFENGKYEVNFSNEEGNSYIPNDGVGDGYYFTIEEIEKFSDLNIEKNNENEIDLIGESDDWKLTDRDYEEVSFKVMKNNIEELMKENYGDFVRAIISIENNIDDLEVLDNIYEKYMDNDFKLINDKFEELKNELGKDRREMISADKEKEIRKKIREHEEWINSKGIRGKQLNLENENLSGMMLLNMDLRNANLKNADITQCVIFADLRGANLEGAKIDNTKWTGSNISKMTIEANKLNLIEYQLEQEGCKHTEARKSLKTNRKDVELER